MRKILFFLAAFAMLATKASAETEIAVGANLSYGTEVGSVALGVKGQLNIIKSLRVEASFDNYFEIDDVSAWDLNANLHYLIPVAEKVTVYPLAGITYINVSSDGNGILGSIGNMIGVDTSYSYDRFGANVGAGIEYNFNDSWKMSFETKYQIIKDVNQAVFSLGAAYKF